MAEAEASTSATGAPELGREEEVLVRVTVNYLYLAQFETFRASLKTLRDKNPGLALSVLQTVVERGGVLDGPVAWSARTRSPAQLAFLALSELIEIDEGDGACLWGLDPDSLKLKAEFLLLIDSIKESIVISPDADEDNKESTLTRIGASLCDAVADEGVQRFRGAVSGLGITEAGYNVLSDDEMRCWRDITLRYPQLVDDLCRNIRAQVGVDLDCSLTVSVYQGEGEGEGSSGFIDDFPLGLTLRREAQRAHLEAIKDALQRDDVDACIDQLRFLRVGDGVELLSYRGLIIDLCKRIITGVDSFGESWTKSRERMLRIYEKLLASEDIQLIKMVTGIQNDLIKEAAEAFRVSNESTFPPPLKKLITSLQSLRSQVKGNSGEKTAAEDLIIRSSKRELFHYAHVTGEHIFDIVLKAAVVAIKNEQLEDASDVLAIFPRLQPLMAAMGWDLLSGKTLARRKLMEVLWTSKSNQLRIDDSSVYGKQGEEVSCVEYLCNHLCYRLELAYFSACKNSGHDWDSKTSLIFSGRKGKGNIEDIDGGPFDPFVANLVLERLAVQSPLRVLFDVVPNLKFHNALELLNMQPIYSPQAAWQRIQDVEMLHMHYAIQSTVLALGLMERNMPKVGSLRNTELVWCYLKDLEGHMEAVGNLPRKLFLTNIIIALLHMDGLSVSQSFYEINIPETRVGDKLNGGVLTPDMDISEKQMAISVVSFFLKLLYQSIPSEGVEVEIKPQWNGVIEGSVKQSLEWKATTIKQFVEDWEWRLSALKCLLPSPDCHWTWKEALAILRAAPSTLLNLCMQRAQYEIGEQAVKRFGLPPEDKAALQLAEWVDGAFTRASIEDVMSRVATGAMNEESSLDFAAFRSQLGSLATGLLCTDAAMTSARSVAVAKQLLHQAWALISEISVGNNEKLELSHWEQIQELCIIAVAKRIIQRLQDFLEQSSTGTVQGLLTGSDMRMSFYESYRQSNRYRALISLDQVIEDAIKGKRQFLSGKLHNLVKAMSDEEFDEASARLGSNYLDKKASSGSEHDILVGLGLRPVRQTSSAVPVSEQFGENVNLNTKGVGKRFQVFFSKSLPYLSAFIQYIATIGDIVDGIDTTHDFNYFTLVYDWPSDVLTRLVFERGSEDAAGKIAEIMGADLVHEIISACVPPVYAPRTNQGWACIPSIPYSHFESDTGFSSTSSKNKFCRSFTSKTTKSKLYPLRLDVVKHLSTLSPVRAVLACVFGSMFSPFGKTISGKDSEVSVLSEDDERTFYEFALDQSYRFPTLNRWIQMQANIHRLLDSPITSKPASEARVQVKAENRSFRKRHRDYTNETEPEEDEGINGGFVATPSKVSVDVESKDDKAACSAQNEEKELKASEPESCGYLYFDWENEGPYEEAVERLIAEGKLLDALALSDRCLKDGASDHLLQFLIEREEGYSRSNQLNSHGMRHNVWSNTWQYCIRLRDKRLAATLALKYLHHWELSAAMDVLTMCCCHLSPHDSLRSEVLRMKEALEKYKHILNADGQYFSWQEVEADFKEDPEGLALRLAAKGAVSAALAVAESASLPIELRRELQGRQLVKLLTTDPVSGGGPAEASRFLSSLREPEDALPVAMGAMQQLPNLRSKRLLVHFILKHRAGALSDADNARLNRWALGLKVLAALPLPWQQRCSALHEHPHLILETLLMWKQLQSAQELVKEFPSLRDKNLIFKYAAKAITVTAYPYVERHTATVPVTSQHNSRSTMSAKLNFSSSISNFQKEARKAFSWGKSDNGNKLVPKEVTRKRKSSALPFSQRVAWEAMTGMQEERGNFMSTDGQERHTSVAITEGWVLTGDSVKDESVRQSHRYESAPDIILFKALLSLCLDDVVAAKGAIDLCTVEMENVLSSSKLPLNGSTETVGRAYHATETFVEALSHAKAQLKLIIGRTESTLKEHKSLDIDDTSSDTGTGTSSISSGPNVELTELLSQADLWLGHAKLLQSLLGSGVVASLDDVRDRQSATLLRDRLIKEERYSMAVYTCKMCKIDAFAVWNAWGQALLRMEHYDQARVKLGKAIQLYKDKPVPVVLDIINIMESGPPVDIAGVRSLYNHLAKSAPTIVDDSLSADSYLNVLYMPSSFPRSERLRKPSEGSTDIYKQISAQVAGDDEPRSNLDSVRYTECVKYLEEYAREELLAFMFRHGRYSDACMLFFPANSMPLPPQSPPSQKTDPLATDYGSIDDLCALCVGYGAMDVLEHVIAVRNDGPSSIDSAIKEHTSAALTKICNYCETHRHFNHLYRFQVLKNDHIAAGLCSIQLFLNSSNQDQALKHLEHAKMHFDEGFAARHKAGESNRMIAKTARMKSASDKLTEDELLKFSARIGIQMEVVRSFSDADGPPWKHSLFGNPNDTETFRRRCEVAETLVERNFDLAFRIIHLFELPACHIYAGVAASIAERKKGNQLTDFLKNIKGTVDDVDWDQVLGAAINVFANKHRERPDRLIDMLSSSHRKVLACVVCGRLKTAFQIASRSGNVADVQYVAHQAVKTGAHPVLDMCKQWLAEYM